MCCWAPLVDQDKNPKEMISNEPMKKAKDLGMAFAPNGVATEHWQFISNLIFMKNTQDWFVDHDNLLVSWWQNLTISGKYISADITYSNITTGISDSDFAYPANCNNKCSAEEQEQMLTATPYNDRVFAF